ncbi:hypothetical protein AXF42_Ash014177 [Apostasia shenzhenica]|uniref:Uncharacterized protein n=1 Tax=Apostasia shenzhenica TaxID=1088818 RepID=A0A2I0A159_9ASPA|nr:hypothetical protein AXF42_Ash014177 [Apostasia shenzhenica]
MVRSVNFSNDNPIIVIPPDSNQTVTLSKPHLSELPTHHHPSSTTPVAVEHKEPSKVRFSPGPDIQRASPPQSDPAQPKQTTVKHNPPHCYVMSPLPRWEERPRRREYFSGEYSYYPTPLREGIYSIATDANRLTTIFSEENPNACSIA